MASECFNNYATPVRGGTVLGLRLMASNRNTAIAKGAAI